MVIQSNFQIFMLETIASDFDLFIQGAKLNFPYMLWLLAGLYVFNIIHWMTGKKLNILGLRPRRPIGLLGLIFSPLLHADFNHLFFNSFPLFALGLFVMNDSMHTFLWATGIIAFIGGSLVWLFGRRAVHVGASGVISGYFGYVVVAAYQQPTFTTVFLCGVALYYFGGILFSLFPTKEKTSWEGHLFGFLAGLAAQFICIYLNL